jgi:hypothetical protein
MNQGEDEKGGLEFGGKYDSWDGSSAYHYLKEAIRRSQM